MLRLVADLGNSRMKWGRLDRRGRLGPVVALPTDDPAAWEAAWSEWHAAGAGPSDWSISSVNPPLADRLGSFLRARGVAEASWYRSAAEVPVVHELAQPETAGADRALAVLAVLADRPPGQAVLVVLCGTAVTVERTDARGVWQGGAITAGLGLTARALHGQTAQLPLIAPTGPPAPWGNATAPALEAGVFFGVVGAVRELLTRQSDGLSPAPAVVCSGGDAEVLARALGWPGARVVPDLVLRGLARLARRHQAGAETEAQS